MFTKQPKRQWPWLIENRLEDEEDGEEDKTEETSNNTEYVSKLTIKISIDLFSFSKININE